MRSRTQAERADILSIDIGEQVANSQSALNIGFSLRPDTAGLLMSRVGGPTSSRSNDT